MTNYKHMFLFLTSHGLVIRCYRTPMPMQDHTMTDAWYKSFGLREWLTDFDEVIVAEDENIKFRKMALNSTSIFLKKQADKIFTEGIEIDKRRVELVCIHCKMTLENHSVYVGCQKHNSPTYLAYLLPKPIDKEMKYKYITIKRVKDEVFEGMPVYRVFNNKSDDQLAIISYYKPFKQYVFTSQEGCVFNNSCLRDVLDFIDNLETTT